MPKQASKDDNKPVTKKVLLDTLGDFFLKVIAPYFDRIEDKLAEHDKKFEKVDSEFEKIDRRFDSLEDHLFDQKDTLKNYEKRLSVLESS